MASADLNVIITNELNQPYQYLLIEVYRINFSAISVPAIFLICESFPPQIGWLLILDPQDTQRCRGNPINWNSVAPHGDAGIVAGQAQTSDSGHIV